MSKKVKLTFHAKQRALEFNIPLNHLFYALKKSEKYKLTKGMRASKMRKWGDAQRNVYFRQYENLLFTLKDTEDRWTGKPITLLVTVTDMRINFPS